MTSLKTTIILLLLRKTIPFYYVDMLRNKPFFSLKIGDFLKLWKLWNTLRLSFICSEIFYKQKKAIFSLSEMIIRSDCSFCDQNLQSVAILHKVRNFHLHFFFNSNSYFLQNNFHCNIPLGRGILTIRNWSVILNLQKVLIA